jgi:1,4-dihydroxy-2-naphthoate polyprenyltransferase
VLGLFLVWIGGWPILAIGVASIFCAVIYTAGPFPLAYNGLGDIFVFVFFGIAAVTGTHYVQALAWSTDALGAALPMGAISTAILVVNNYRDIDTDRGAAKRTLAVRMGRAATRIEYVALLAVAYFVPVAQVLAGGIARLPLLLTLGSLPLAVPLVRTIYTVTDGPRLNAALGGTGRLLALFAILYSLGHLL